MLRNFLVVGIRNFLKQRTQSILNVSGLGIGLACSIFVYLYAFDELTYDRQHPDPGNTYRLLWKNKGPDGQDRTNAWAVLGWAHYMKENLKGVKGYSSLNTIGWPHSYGGSFSQTDDRRVYRWNTPGVLFLRSLA